MTRFIEIDLGQPSKNILDENAVSRESLLAIKYRDLLIAAHHDLQQPILALKLFSGLLSGFCEDPRAAETTGKIHEVVCGMQNLVQKLTTEAINQPDLSVAKAEIPVAKVFKHIGTVNTNIAEEKGLQLEIHPTSICLATDPVRLESILMNLVKNAIQNTDSGRIDVQCKRHAKNTDITVSDTGVGIPKSDIQNVFKLGERLSDDNAGHGAGLMIVRLFAEQLGARISLRSVLGVGTTVRIRFPDETQCISLPAQSATLH